MAIIGCDWHARYQPIAMLDFSGGEIVRRRWEHEQGEARAFYAGLPQPSLIGIEATGYTQWFECRRAQFGTRVGGGRCGGDSGAGGAASEDRGARRGAPAGPAAPQPFAAPRVPSPAGRDLRQRLKHRDKRVRMQTSIKNSVHFLAMSQGLCRKTFSFHSRKLVSYLGLNPSEASRGGRQRLGPISKQSNSMLRWLLVEAGQSAAGSIPSGGAIINA